MVRGIIISLPRISARFTPVYARGHVCPRVASDEDIDGPPFPIPHEPTTRPIPCVEQRQQA